MPHTDRTGSTPTTPTPPGAAAATGRSSCRNPIATFRPDALPVLARANYSREIVAAFFLPMLLVGIETSILSVLVRVGYSGVVPDAALNLAVAVIMSSVAAANILSFVWVRVTNGRRKIRSIIALQLAVAVLAMAITLVDIAPRSAETMWTVVALAILARICWAGIITLRSTVWRLNYDRPTRARVAGQFASVQTAMLAGLGACLGFSMEHNPSLYHWIVPAAIMISLVGIWSWTRVRVRGEAALIRDERSPSDAAGGAGSGPSFNPLALVSVLRNDPMFARYMGCMFLLGTGNLTVLPLVVIVLREQFGEAYLGGIGITHSIPLAIMPLAIPLWTRLLQRTHVIRFRAVHAWVFVSAIVCVMVASFTREPWVLVVWAVLQGLGFAGGALAWNLGHLDFAPPHLASQYMGVHVTLTGVRGLMAPFLGVGVYEILTTHEIAHFGFAFGVSLLLAGSGAVGFVRLSRRLTAETTVHDVVEPVAPSQGRT